MVSTLNQGEILLHISSPLSFLFSQFSSVQFSRSVMSDSLRPHEPQHARPPCPSPTPRVHPNSCALSRWCHPAISPSVVPSSSCPQSLPASGSFQWVSSSHQVVKVFPKIVISKSCVLGDSLPDDNIIYFRKNKRLKVLRKTTWKKFLTVNLLQ